MGGPDEELEFDPGVTAPAPEGTEIAEAPRGPMVLTTNAPPAPHELAAPATVVFEPSGREAFTIDRSMDPLAPPAFPRGLVEVDLAEPVAALEILRGVRELEIAAEPGLVLDPVGLPPLEAAPERAPAPRSARATLLVAELDALLDDLRCVATLSPERRCAVLARRLGDLLTPLEDPDILADLLVRCLMRLPIESVAERIQVEAALLGALALERLVDSTIFLARELVADAGEARLEVIARVVTALAGRLGNDLDGRALELVRALEEEGAGLQRHLSPELRQWAEAGRYLRPSATDAAMAARALETATNARQYATELASLERAAQILSAASRWPSLAPLLAALGHHGLQPEAPFVERRAMAMSCLTRCLPANVAARLVAALPTAGAAAFGSIVQLLELAGPAAVPALEDALARPHGVAAPEARSRRAIESLLARSRR